MHHIIKKILISLIMASGIVTLTACSPEVGSDKWCDHVKAQPSGDWTANEAANYAKFCLLK